jgi:hypothetical protein
MADTVSLTATVLDHEVIAVDDIPWTDGMTILSLMEAVYDSGEAPPSFSFMIGYFGKDLGYLLYDINQIGDQPCVFWRVAINGERPKSGLDKDPLNAGDAVTMTYSWCGQSEAAEDALVAAKFDRERENPALEVQV